MFTGTQSIARRKLRRLPAGRRSQLGRNFFPCHQLTGSNIQREVKMLRMPDISTYLDAF